MSHTLIETFLADLERALRRHGVSDCRMLEEAREHLIDAVENEQRKGLTPEAAQNLAIERFGTAATVAAKFAAERFRFMNRVIFGVAVLLGVAIAYVDSRPHWDDTGITAFSLLISAGLLGLICPRHAWLWALGIGIWIPLYQIAHKPTLGWVVGGLAILAFPMLGAYTGMFFRRVLSRV